MAVGIGKRGLKRLRLMLLAVHRMRLCQPLKGTIRFSAILGIHLGQKPSKRK